LLCRVVTKIVSECWNIIFVHPHWGFFHYLHTTSVIVSYLTLRIQVLTCCHTRHKYISDCCTGYCSSINSFITDSIEIKKFDVICSSVVWSGFSSVLIGFLLTKISDLAAVTRLGCKYVNWQRGENGETTPIDIRNG